jgi:hypothetical protein
MVVPGGNVRAQKTTVRCMIGLVTLSLLAACPHPADGLSAGQSAPREETGSRTAARADTLVNVPKQAGPWIRPDAPRRITEDTIFDYMDGAGELYLAYRFDHLDVYEYPAPDRLLGSLKVELYWMKSSDDAFGLLSTDWGGEVIDLRGQTEEHDGGKAGASPRQSSKRYPAIPSHDALYGGGLLRFWSGNLYGRVMASRESDSSRSQVLAIARSIAGGRPSGNQPPEVLSRIPARMGERFAIRPDRTSFFRSHYVLNSVYYLAPDDVLGLGPAVDASISEYRPAATGAAPVRLIQVAYPSSDAAARALRSFLTSYLPAAAGRVRESTSPASARSDGGWVGWAAADRWLAIVFDAPGEQDAKELAGAALAAFIHQ